MRRLLRTGRPTTRVAKARSTLRGTGYRPCSTNAIESLNGRYRRAVTVRGHFPAEQAGPEVSLPIDPVAGPKGTGQQRWTARWKPALNAFAITFGDRMPKAENH